MSDISKIKYLDNVIYNIKDEKSRNAIGKLVNDGVKNLVNVYDAENYNGQTVFPITLGKTKFTVNADNSISANSASETDIALRIPVTLEPGSYMFSVFGGRTGSSSTFYVNVIEGVLTYSYTADTDDPIIINGSSSTTVYIDICIHSGYNPNGITFYPMLYNKEFYDISPDNVEGIYEPYAVSNGELTSLSTNNHKALANVIDNGAKNYLEQSNFTVTKWLETPINLKAGSYILYRDNLTTNDTDYSSSLCRFYSSSAATLDDVCGQVALARRDGAAPVTITEDAVFMRLYASDSEAHSEGDTLTGTNMMICHKAAWDISQTYQPYRPSEDEQNAIIATKVTMDNVYGTAEVIPDNSNLNDYRTPGKYGVSSSTHTATIANIPEGGSGFTLLVIGLNDGISYIRQIFIKSNRPGYYYVRHYTGGSWSDWYKFEENTIPIENRAALVELIDEGPKNVLRFDGIASSATGTPSTSTTYRGVLYTINADGTLTFKRTSSNSNNSTMYLFLDTTALDISNYCNGEYMLAVYADTAGSSTTYMPFFTNPEGGTSIKCYDYVDIPNKTSTSAIRIGIQVQSTYSVTTDLTIKYMIVKKAFWNISQTYQPYRPTYQELYEMVKALQT